MEERIKKIESELDQIKEFINKFSNFMKSQEEYVNANAVFSKTVGEFMTVSSQRIIDNEKATIELFEMNRDKINEINSKLDRKPNG
jgi:hypothetical protein